METIIDKIRQWAFLRTLVPEIAGMKLRLEDETIGTKYLIFSYADETTRRCFTVLYDDATKDYMGRVTIGLTQYVDIKYIATDLAVLEKTLTEHLAKTLATLNHFDRSALSSVFLEKGILEWPYVKKLPNEISGFQLFISPQQPIVVINGSYLILDYSDFLTQSNFMLYYNIYRDEFFGEMRIRRTPKTTAYFDAKTLPELEKALDTGLAQTIRNMRLTIDQGADN